MRKQPQITEATRKTFITAFMELYEEKPVEKITIQELSSKAGYNRSTFYQYFKDIYDLLEYIEEDLLKYIKVNIGKKIGIASLDESFLQVFISMYQEKDLYLRVLFGSHNSARFIYRLKNELIVIFSEKVNIQTDSKVYLLDFYLSGILAVISRWFISQKDMSLEKFALLMRHIVNGMAKSGLLET